MKDKKIWGALRPIHSFTKRCQTARYLTYTELNTRPPYAAFTQLNFAVLYFPQHNLCRTILHSALLIQYATPLHSTKPSLDLTMDYNHMHNCTYTLLYPTA